MYYQTFLEKKELIERISNSLEPELVTKVISAYEMAENAYSNLSLADSTPMFFHITRVCRIIIDELEIIDSDLIIASLLHDVFISNTELNHNIISFNFGYYVTFLVDVLTDDAIDFKSYAPKQIDLMATAGLDGMIIRLAEILDEIRCIEFNKDFLPIPYFSKVTKYYLSKLEKTNEQKINYLIHQIRNEANKLLQ